MILILFRLAMVGKEYKGEKIDMEGVRAPYMLLRNHMYQRVMAKKKEKINHS